MCPHLFKNDSLRNATYNDSSTLHTPRVTHRIPLSLLLIHTSRNIMSKAGGSTVQVNFSSWHLNNCRSLLICFSTCLHLKLGKLKDLELELAPHCNTEFTDCMTTANKRPRFSGNSPQFAFQDLGPQLRETTTYSVRGNTIII